MRSAPRDETVAQLTGVAGVVQRSGAPVFYLSYRREGVSKHRASFAAAALVESSP